MITRLMNQNVKPLQMWTSQLLVSTVRFWDLMLIGLLVLSLFLDPFWLFFSNQTCELQCVAMPSEAIA
jgi:hypothetical protein